MKIKHDKADKKMTRKNPDGIFLNLLSIQVFPEFSSIV